MSNVKYNPKELLSVLVELDARLKVTVEKNCLNSEIYLQDNLDNSLEDFYMKSSVFDNDIGFLSSQLALFQLSKEVSKTIDIVVETNDLQALHDFSKYKVRKPKNDKCYSSRIRVRDLIIGALIGIAIALILFYTLN